MDGRRDAGDFAAWITRFRAALAEGTGMDVPCGGCTACCESSQFVHIEPDEQDALARIPPALVVPAPGRPAGHVVLGYDQHGRCPMLVDGRCSIYEHRPRACRSYDCRVYAAAGLEPDQPLVAARVREWEWRSASPESESESEDGKAEIRSRAAVFRSEGARPIEAALRATATDQPGP